MKNDYVCTDSTMYASVEKEDIGGNFGDIIWGDI